MIIKLCIQNNITPICIVRRPEQAKFLSEDLKQKHVIDTSDKNYQKQLGKICMEL